MSKNLDYRYRNGRRRPTSVTILVPCIIVLIIFYTFSFRNHKILVENDETSTVTTTPMSLVVTPHRDLKEQQSCEFPKLEIDNPSILELMEAEDLGEPLDCTKNYPLLFESFLETEKNFPSRLVPVGDMSKVKYCCYRTVIFGGDKEFSEECRPLSLIKETVILDEYIAVECTFPTDEGEEDNAEEVEAPKSSKSNRKIVDMHVFVNAGVKKKIQREGDKPNVMILGVDSMSRLNFHRTMPQTRDYMVNELMTIELEGMNKIGDNTYPNIGVMLTNHLISDDYSVSCIANGSSKACDFLWLLYATKGYRSVYTEDEVSMGLFELLELGGINGSQKTPEAPEFYFPQFLVLLDKYLGHERRITSNWCLGPRPALQVALEYLKKVTVAMEESNENYFQFGWFTALTHDFLNGGRLADKMFKSFLEWFRTSGYFDNTVVIFMSDHGARIGDIRVVDQGMLEDRLPFLFIALPNWWKERFPYAVKNLEANRKRLTTVWDVRQTLENILSPELEHLRNNVGSGLSSSNQPGVSLFTPVPLSRTCETAGIPLVYCTCNYHAEPVVPLNDSLIVHEVVGHVLTEINSILEPHQQCLQLSLGKILEASKITFKNDDEDDTSLAPSSAWQAYHVVFDTVPKWTTFDALVVWEDEDGLGRKWVPKNIGRSTWYWLDQRGACLGQWSKKLKTVMAYCYCRK